MRTQPIKPHPTQQRRVQNDRIRRFFGEDLLDSGHHPRMTYPFQRFEP